jgi:hypothetical protein
LLFSTQTKRSFSLPLTLSKGGGIIEESFIDYFFDVKIKSPQFRDSLLFLAATRFNESAATTTTVSGVFCTCVHGFTFAPIPAYRQAGPKGVMRRLTISKLFLFSSGPLLGGFGL